MAGLEQFVDHVYHRGFHKQCQERGDDEGEGRHDFEVAFEPVICFAVTAKITRRWLGVLIAVAAGLEGCAMVVGRVGDVLVIAVGGLLEVAVVVR